MKNVIKPIALSGIAAEIVYFLSVTLFLVTKADAALTFWELMTVIGAAAILAVLVVVTDRLGMKRIYRTFMLISLSATMIITSIAHITSIGVVRPLVAEGKDIPDFVRIGFFPSIEMTLDYTAWGLFMGLAFLSLYLGISGRSVRILSLICAALCFAGFVGSFFSESLWYLAPAGYGIGFLIMCVMFMRMKPGDINAVTS
ncbi:hypothetical protein SAMN02910317_00619 [Ruminococcaceae bacterium FB2012]|nr:hypothetical protein SAMN02910317_00619 [Ruminococcaceae bacterium FB2012]